MSTLDRATLVYLALCARVYTRLGMLGRAQACRALSDAVVDRYIDRSF